jgi:hypothetical protein
MATMAGGGSIMHAWTVLIGNLPAKEGVDQCPFGLLVPEQYGAGATIHKCQLKAAHKEPHREKVLFPGESVGGVLVTTTWQDTLHLLPCDSDDGHKVMTP